eukprot:2639800-Prymnesium_polylepis.2
MLQTTLLKLGLNPATRQMHCSLTQQRKLAKMLVKHLGTQLLTVSRSSARVPSQFCIQRHLNSLSLPASTSESTVLRLTQYDEICQPGRASALSPHDLNRRVLAKGKIKPSRRDAIALRRSTKHSEAERRSQANRGGVSESCRSNSEVAARRTQGSGRRSSEGATPSRMLLRMTSGLNLKFMRSRAQMTDATPGDSNREADADEEVVTQTLSSAQRDTETLCNNAEATVRVSNLVASHRVQSNAAQLLPDVSS